MMLPVAAMAAGSLSDKQTKYLLIAGGVLIVGGVWYLHWQAGRAIEAISGGVKEVAKAVNPVDQENIFNRAANGVFRFVSGNDTDSIGTAIAGLFESDPDY